MRFFEYAIGEKNIFDMLQSIILQINTCLLYTSDAADEL